MSKNPLAKASESMLLTDFFNPQLVSNMISLVVADEGDRKALSKEVVGVGQKILYDVHKRHAYTTAFVLDITCKHVREIQEEFTAREAEVLRFYLSIFGHTLIHSEEWFRQRETPKEVSWLLKVAGKFYAQQGSG
jgi:hypothetical protein